MRAFSPLLPSHIFVIFVTFVTFSLVALVLPPPASRLPPSASRLLGLVAFNIFNTFHNVNSSRLPSPVSRLSNVESLLEVMERRRSVRRLQSGPFTEEMRERLLEAVRLTPSSYNLPPWRVVLVTERRAELWNEIEHGFRETLSEDRLERYLQRLDGFRNGVAVALVFVDRSVERELRERGLEPEVAQSFVLQALGMVQYGLWLAITAAGLVASLQHWDHLVGPRLAHFAALPEDQFALIATIPIGYAAETPPPIARSDSVALT